MTDLRVIFDGRRLHDQPPGGVGRTLANLVPRLAEKVDLVILTDALRDAPHLDVDVPLVPLRRPPRTPEFVWLQVSAAQWLRRNGGLFHGTFFGVPYLAPRPTVATIYDVSFEHRPEDFSPSRRFAFRFQARHAARTAQRILTISEHARGQIVEGYGVDPARILLAPCAVDPVFAPERAAQAPAVLDRLGCKERYVVAVGGAPRRQLTVAVAAWQRVARDIGDVALVVVGKEEPLAQSGAHFVGPTDDETWAALLAGAEALIYPTLFEGFGMPALEAAASGTPVVAAPIGPLPEVLGDAAEWVPDATVEAMANGLRHVLDDADHRAGLRAAGLARAADAPTWDDAASVHLRAYQEAFEEGDGRAEGG